MKKRINLLNPEVISTASAGSSYLKFPLLRGPLLIKTLTIFLVILAVLTVYQQVNFNIFKYKLLKEKKKYSNSQIELKQNKDIMAKLNTEKNTLIRKRKSLEEKMFILANVTKPPVESSAILVALAGLVPDDLWITKITFDKKKIKMVGKAINNATISDFMLKLDKSPYFENTTFTYTEKKKADGQVAIEFEIVSNLQIDMPKVEPANFIATSDTTVKLETQPKGK